MRVVQFRRVDAECLDESCEVVAVATHRGRAIQGHVVGRGETLDALEHGRAGHERLDLLRRALDGFAKHLLELSTVVVQAAERNVLQLFAAVLHFFDAALVGTRRLCIVVVLALFAVFARVVRLLVLGPVGIGVLIRVLVRIIGCIVLFFFCFFCWIVGLLIVDVVDVVARNCARLRVGRRVGKRVGSRALGRAGDRAIFVVVIRVITLHFVAVVHKTSRLDCA